MAAIRGVFQKEPVPGVLVDSLDRFSRQSPQREGRTQIGRKDVSGQAPYRDYPESASCQNSSEPGVVQRASAMTP